ncbi:MAG: DUF1150 family protein [Rhodospirillaceae bacterium]|nr:MAG: DUF1150 family protein [Rhodospirillaceae bacterium]
MVDIMMTTERIREISAQELLALGLKDIAYLKEIEVDGGTAVAIHAANGQQIALMPDRNAAVAAVWENGMAPVALQ